MNEKQEFKPYIAPEKVTPELTVTSIIMGVLLAVVFGAANAYLGLRVGMTVSASIPAAVIYHGEVYDHIYLVSAVFYCVGSLESLGGGGHVAVGEADNGADPELIADIALCSRNMAGRNAYAGALMLYRLIAQGLYLLRGAIDPQQRVVTHLQNCFNIHGIILSITYFYCDYILSVRHIQAPDPNII